VPQRLRRRFFAWATPGYLGAIALVSGLLVTIAIRYAMSAGWGGLSLLLVALLTLVPASELTIHVLQRLISYWIPPRRLPRIELEAIPAAARTMVIVPTLLDSEARVAEMLAVTVGVEVKVDLISVPAPKPPVPP